MALTSKITKTLNIPGEDGQTVTIKKLSHHEVSMAKDARIDALAAKMRAFEGVTLPTPDAGAAKTIDPKEELDRMTVLRYGVTAWTYDVAPSEGVVDLDEDTAAWLFDEIAAFSLRSADEGKASANDSPLTTGQAEGVGQSN